MIEEPGVEITFGQAGEEQWPEEDGRGGGGGVGEVGRVGGVVGVDRERTLGQFRRVAKAAVGDDAGIGGLTGNDSHYSTPLMDSGFWILNGLG